MDIQPLLETLTQGKWDSRTADITQLGHLREWFFSNSVESHWLEDIQNALLSAGSVGQAKTDIHDTQGKEEMFLDIQLLDVLSRVSIDNHDGICVCNQ